MAAQHKQIRRLQSEAYEEDRKKFGTLFLENDLAMDAETAYQVYACRWKIKLVIGYYTQSCELDETRVHSDDPVIESKVFGFLSSVLIAFTIGSK